MNRRKFISTSCKACIAIGFAGSAASLLESCSSLPIYKTVVEKNKLKIPAEKLLQANPFLLVRENSLEYDILILKQNEKYQAIYLQCTHENSSLIVSEKKISCAAHGSEFALEGNVLKGPADKPLKQFKAHMNNAELIVSLQ